MDQSSFGVKPDDNGVPLQCVRERLARVTSPRRSRMAWMVLQAGKDFYLVRQSP